MDFKKLQTLKIAVNQFYMNKFMDLPLISDEEYDSLKKEYRSEGNSEMDLVEWEAKKEKNTLPIGLNKVVVESNDLRKYAVDWLNKKVMTTDEYKSELPEHREIEGYNPYNYIGCYFNFKYDGCSILGFYESGRLKEVRSTPDEEFGIVRTKAFIGIFPEIIDDKSVIALQGEALVDYRAYGQLARNKANGLVNSIYKDDEVAREIFVRIYKVYYNDDQTNHLTSSQRFYRQLRTLNHIPLIKKNRVRLAEDGTLKEFSDVVFSGAYKFGAIHAPYSPLVCEQTTQAYFQIDGIVAYTENESLAMKFYYTESAITTVRNIEWNLQANGGWAPKVQFDEIILNDKRISQASSGGTPNMLAMKFGVGAKVRVILANMTIPKIIEVLETSENYNYPKCECGYQISKNDIFGSSVKCQSIHCSRRVDQWYNELIRRKQDSGFDQLTNFEWLEKDPVRIIGGLLHIDRWDPYTKYRVKLSPSTFLTYIMSSLHDLSEFLRIVKDNYYFSDLQLHNLLANYGPALEALKRFVSA